MAAVLLVAGVNPWLACLAALACGVVAGIITGLLHVKLGITDLLCGILMMTALYSINLRIMGRSNIALFDTATVFDILPAHPWSTVAVVAVLALLLKTALNWFFKTRTGMLVRAVGDSPQLVTSLGQDLRLYKVVGLALGNGLVALSGAVMAQVQGYADVNMGTGTIVMGLASVILGLGLFRRSRWIMASTRVIIGAVLYRALVALALQLGLKPEDLKLITAVLMVLILVLNRIRWGSWSRKGRRREHAGA